MTSQATPETFAFEPPPLPDLDLIEETISGFTTNRVTGQVAAVAGESIEIEGMTAPIGAICEIESLGDGPKRCQVIGFRGVRPILAPLERLQSVAAGDHVRMISTTLNIHAGDGLCGRVIDAFGRPLDDRELPRDLSVYNANRQPPESLDRPSIDQPLQTGVRDRRHADLWAWSTTWNLCWIWNRQKHVVGYAGARQQCGSHRDWDGR